MDQIASLLAKLLPAKWQPWVMFLIAISPWIGRAYHAVTNGGGLKGMFAGIWLGTNTPTPVPNVAASPKLQEQNPAMFKPKAPLMLIIGLASILALNGCQTAVTTAYKASTGTQITVQAAMTAYSTWLQANPSVSVSTRESVANAYAKYQAAAIEVLDAEELLGTISATNSASLTTAQGQLQTAAVQADQALTDLVNLLQTFGVNLSTTNATTN